MLMSMGSMEAALPAPLSEGEVVDRLVRLMRGAGVKYVRLAYLRAFPRPHSVDQTLKALGTEAAQIEIPRDKWPKTLKKLYKMCPELNRTGYPSGYPLRGGKMAQLEWVQKEFVLYHVTKQSAAKRAVLLELDREGTDARDGDAQEAELLRPGQEVTARPDQTQTDNAP